MVLSGHAKAKLEIYNISGDEIIEACTTPLYEFYDVNEDAHIIIVELQGVIFAVVYNKKTQIIITVYRTNLRTIINRQKNNRWI